MTVSKTEIPQKKTLALDMSFFIFLYALFHTSMSYAIQTPSREQEAIHNNNHRKTINLEQQR